MKKILDRIRQLLQYNHFINGKKILIITLLTSNYMSSQMTDNASQIPPPPCYANGNSGFGGAVGEGHFLYSDPNSIVWFQMTTSSNDMNDILVLYIDTGASGRNEIDANVDDSQDDHRIAITNSNAFGYGSIVEFPTGFEASYAVAINVSFGGLWSIPSTGSIGVGELDFITSVNSTLSSSTQEFYEFSFDWADIGLTDSDSFNFVGVYVSSTAYSSDEAYGSGIVSGTEGSDDITFNGYLSFPGCSETLNEISNSFDNVTVNYFNDQLFIKGINEITTISVYDILGRKIYREDHQIQENVPIELELNKNELQFIVIESSNKKKVIKVIPN
ncbi:hypothetical protein [Winogradskyella sp.]|uniref:hypothetical protein n=1 Tax=Winogradskyella sp. TaxID=1883156 RepID=UPI0025F4C28D|nr:hypothetical protein [Winogradskyella sp.]